MISLSVAWLSRARLKAAPAAGALLRRGCASCVVIAVALALVLGGCAGISLSTMVRFARFDHESLLRLDPAAMIVAIQTDAQVQAIERSPTTFELRITPRDPSQWPALERALPMQIVPLAPEHRLSPPSAGRHWLLFGFDAASAQQLREIQAQFRQLQAEAQQGARKSSGGSVGVGIGQAWLAEHYPQLRERKVETWLRLDRQEGFFKLWAGTVGDLERIKPRDKTARQF